MCNIKLLKIILFISILSIGCNGDNLEFQKAQYNTFNDISAAAWESLSKKKIFFGHQSVGNNIIAGLSDLLKANSQIKLNIVETTDPAALKTGVFAHFSVGKNSDPISKIEDFVRIMETNVNGKVDIAFFKFCFVDINAKTDVASIFNAYKTSLALLKQKYPKVTFIHTTVPITVLKTTFKTWIKKITFRKYIWEYDHLIKRNQFNDLLRTEYVGKETFFDIANIESEYPNGMRAMFTRDGKSYFYMVPDYSDDGGHLNKKGRKKVAKHLLSLLVSL